MAVITFNSKQAAKRLLLTLPERGRDVLVQRFGLGKNTKRTTLESIGNTYGITRERVRQIENATLALARKSSAAKKEEHTFNELRKFIKSLGGVVSEDYLLESISKDKSIQNHAYLLLVLGEQIKNEKESRHFKKRWIVDDEVAGEVHRVLRKVHKNFSEEDLFSEREIVSAFLRHLEEVSEHYKNEEIIKQWLSVSKEIGKNSLGEWGTATSPNINVRGMRDYAYLVMRRHGSPMHFREVSESIVDIFKKRSHTATCHNELIKDKRFVLVGRGLYALSEWGYEKGVVKNVIEKILETKSPLTSKEIVEKVLKERYVKENTVLVNLQYHKQFKRDSKGRYYLDL